MNLISASFLFLILLIFSTNTFAQTDWTKYEHIVGERSTDPAVLAKKVTEAYDSELEKIEAIYYWVTNNIKYDYNLYLKNKDKPKMERVSREELLARKEKEIQVALQRRKGVCQQYSRVFQAMCQSIGVECEFIGGAVKMSPSLKSNPGSRHAWVAVKHDGEWKLVDPTFGAGYMNNKNKFVFRFEPNYLFVNPELFIMNHHPVDPKWQLLDEEVSKEEFLDFPFVGAKAMEHGVSNLNHRDKRVKVAAGEDFKITFDCTKKIENLKCYKMSTGKPAKVNVQHKGSSCTISIPSNDLRSGKYIFIVGDKSMFAYQVVK